MDAPSVRPPLFTNKVLVSMTVPVVLDALLQILAGTVDAAMVSSAGETAVSAVSLVDAINTMFLAIISSLAVGGSVITTQYIGCRNYDKAQVSANQLLYVTTGIAAIFMALLLCFHGSILRLIYGQLEADVFVNSKDYFFLTILGYPFMAAGSAACAVLRAMGKNRQAATAAILSNVANIIGNAVLIYGFRMGVAGAAVATTVSRVVYAVLGLTMAHSKRLAVRFHKVLRFRLNWGVMRRVLVIGMVNGLENALFHIGKIMISSLISGFGTIVIAANAVANTINNLGWTTVGCFGTVMITVVGQCVGAGEVRQAKCYTKKLLAAASVTTLVLFGGIFLLRYPLVRLFDFGTEGMELAAYYTGVCALMAIASLYSYSFNPLCAFRAAGDIRYSVTLSMFSMFAFRVALCFVINGLIPSIGVMCVYVGMFGDWAFRSVMNIIRYRSGKWLQKKLI